MIMKEKGSANKESDQCSTVLETVKISKQRDNKYQEKVMKGKTKTQQNCDSPQPSTEMG